MSWRPDGTFQRLYSWNADATAGFDILSDRMDADTNDIVGGLERARNLDGYNTPSIDLPMGGHRHTGVAAATASSHYARFDQVVPAGGGTFSGPVTFTSPVTFVNSGGNTSFSTSPGVPHFYLLPGQVDVAIFDGGQVDVRGTLSVDLGAQIGGPLTVNGGLTDNGHLTAISAEITSGMSVGGSVTVNGGPVTVNGPVSFVNAGNTSFSTSLGVPHFYLLPGQADVAVFDSGQVDVRGTLNVDLGAQIGGPVTVNGPVSFVNSTGNISFSTSLGVPHFYLLPGQADVAVFDGGQVDVRGTLNVDLGIGVNAAIVPNSVNVSGNYYRNSIVIPVLAETLQTALSEAPEGALLVIAKSGGVLSAQRLEAGPPDAEGRRALYLAAA